MEKFWERSWENVDRSRVSAYVQAGVQASDPILTLLREQKVEAVCDAGCGCGVYSLQLAANGFQVSGFDVAPAAVEMAKALLLDNHYSDVALKTADITSTGYRDSCFEAVVCRDVLDHMPMAQAAAAVKELLRITRDGGCVVLTMDGTDEEYEQEPHDVSADGDYRYTGGKWKGMVFHPYSESEIQKLVQSGTIERMEKQGDGFLVIIRK